MSGGHKELESRLRAGLATLSLDASPVQIGKLLAYAELLLKWNKVYNLTAIRNPIDVIDLHLLDCLALHAWWLKQSVIPREGAKHWLDVGSGAGLPAIVLAIMQPEHRITSVDAVDKKIAFQRQAKAALELSNLWPLHHRIESLVLDMPVQFITSRAFADLADFVKGTQHLLGRDFSAWVAMKGRPPQDELEALKPLGLTNRVFEVNVPLVDAQRCVVLLEPPQKVAQSSTSQ